jgi:hypothetical protein
LPSVAEKVGTNRILLSGGKFHYPFGNLDLTKEQEIQWRKQEVRAALKLLSMPVEGVTIHTSAELLKPGAS